MADPITEIIVNLLTSRADRILARATLRGIRGSALRIFAAERFGPRLPRQAAELLSSIAESAFEAGRAVGRLESSQSLGESQIPVNPFMTQASGEFARSEIEVDVWHPSIGEPRRLVLEFEGIPTVAEIIESAQQTAFNAYTGPNYPERSDITGPQDISITRFNFMVRAF